MNFKKILASVAAGAMVVSTLALPTFADDALMTKTGNTTGSEKYVVDFSELTEDQVASITKIVADVTVDSGYCNGTIGGNVDGVWTSMNPQGEVSGDGETSGQFVWEFDGSLAAYDEEGNLSPYAEVQFWWVNPFYDENGDEAGAGTATLTAVTFYDASGNVVAPVEETTEEETTTEAEPVAVETAVDAAGVSYNTSAAVSSADYTDADYTSAVVHIDALNYNDNTVAAYWNDWCALKVAVTNDGVTTYYAVIGSSVSWDITVDDMGTDDNEDDIIIPVADCITLDTTNGTDLTVELTGEEWSIEVIALGWDSAPDVAYAQASFTLSGTTEAAVEAETTTAAEEETTAADETTTADEAAATTSDNDASDDGDFSAAVYLVVLVALAGVAFAGAKKFQA